MPDRGNAGSVNPDPGVLDFSRAAGERWPRPPWTRWRPWESKPVTRAVPQAAQTIPYLGGLEPGSSCQWLALGGRLRRMAERPHRRPGSPALFVRLPGCASTDRGHPRARPGTVGG
jgi:hypothetical protein